MNCIAKRGLRALNLKQYNTINEPEFVTNIGIPLPLKRCYTLRMLIKIPFGEFQVPKNLWCFRTLIRRAWLHQHQNIKIIQPYAYLTVRHGIVTSENDDVWHVDGFSMNITHLPEQNYIWSNCYPTEYLLEKFKFPSNFDPSIHNIHQYFSHNRKTKVKILRSNNLYCIDPYVIHRRPYIPEGTNRTFVRISFTPIPIMDDNNTSNPLLPIPKWNRDGIKDFRNNLISYPNK